MNSIKNFGRARNFGLVLAAIFVSMALIAYPPAAQAAAKQESDHLVQKARLTLESFMSDSNMGAFRDLLNRADGVVIAPELLKGAFFVGALGGNAVFMARVLPLKTTPAGLYFPFFSKAVSACSSDRISSPISLRETRITSSPFRIST